MKKNPKDPKILKKNNNNNKKEKPMQ